NYYPIKSCAGTTVDSAQIDERGFVNDRRWLIVNPKWHFLTQREIARMALVQPQVDELSLRLTAPDMNALELPTDQGGQRVEITIWKDSGLGAVDQGDEAAEWLSSFLRREVRLVRFAADTFRQVNQRFAPRESDQVGFADAYPFLFISEASLADLNTQLEAPLPMNRFRPNIVVSGTDEPYAEDRWKVIRIGDVIFDVVKPCARCAITTTDQATAERGKEPLRTLETYRPGKTGGPLFGQNAVQRSMGVVKTGTPVEVVEYRYE
ncbi:MAG: MOSC N-terminal beta barrel domain-containing protein, partial [Chloroflexota bacterium]